jgi:hypothetical protein
MILELLATLSAGLFAGAAIYISLVEHPARMECAVDVALAEFAPSYKRATVIQASLATAGFLSALAAWLMGHNAGWLLGGLLLVAVVPLTLLVILPTNKKLLAPTTRKEPDEARRLLILWGRLHLIRALLSLASLLTFLYLLGR